MDDFCAFFLFIRLGIIHVDLIPGKCQAFENVITVLILLSCLFLDINKLNCVSQQPYGSFMMKAAWFSLWYWIKKKREILKHVQCTSSAYLEYFLLTSILFLHKWGKMLRL